MGPGMVLVGRGTLANLHKLARRLEDERDEARREVERLRKLLEDSK